jgi:hydroxymethylpyrimidine/phosphomethylpyrimidine kinase
VSTAPDLRPCVLVFAGADPSGGAGVYADVQAIAAAGAHALPVLTVITVQDNNRVQAIHVLPAAQVQAQAEALIASVAIAAVKIGIVGSRANAECIAALITTLRQRQPNLPVVLDPVLASGHGDALTREDAVQVLAPLLAHATLITPNLPEASALCNDAAAAAAGSAPPMQTLQRQADVLMQRGAEHVLIKGGHGAAAEVANHLFSAGGHAQRWQWPRLAGEFHGSGCTLASAIAGRLALGWRMVDAVADGQAYCQQALAAAFAIAPGQKIPERSPVISKELS